MKKVWWMLTLGGFLFPTAMAYANGTALLSQCNSAVHIIEGRATSDFIGAGYCMGLLTGVRHTLDAFTDIEPKSTMAACIPQNVSTLQIAKVVLHHLNASPEDLHNEDFTLTVAALVSAFPCD